MYALVTVLIFFILNSKYMFITLKYQFLVEIEGRYSTLMKSIANPQISFKQLNPNLLPLSKSF